MGEGCVDLERGFLLQALQAHYWEPKRGGLYGQIFEVPGPAHLREQVSANHVGGLRTQTPGRNNPLRGSA